MSLVLIENADVLVTMDADRREIGSGAIVIRDNVIQMVGGSEQLRSGLADGGMQADRIIDASGCVILPGLVNCHHHLYQTLTRGLGTAAGKSLFDWLQTLYPIWAEIDAEAVYISARLGLAEMLMSGATTVADHLYLFPNDVRLGESFTANADVRTEINDATGFAFGTMKIRVCALGDCVTVTESFSIQQMLSDIRPQMPPPPQRPPRETHSRRS